MPKRSAMSPRNGENAPVSSIASALANDHSSRPTLRAAAIGFLKEAEALPRTDSDRQDRDAANHRKPEFARLRPVTAPGADIIQ